MTPDENAVAQVIIPRTADIGGFEVYRALPSRHKRMVGPFVFWDQMGPGEFIRGTGVDVRPHPHIGLATVTYLFDGTLDHRDSLGTCMTIAEGDVNLMTAGSGIVHSERTGAAVRDNPHRLYGIQSWLALPQALEEQNPSFEHRGKAELPLIAEKEFSARIIMGSAFGKTAPVAYLHHTVYADVRITKGGTIPLPADAEELAVYPLSGRIRIGDTDYDPMQLLVLNPRAGLVVTALEDAHVMLLGGAVMDGPRHIWWNFVSSRKERIDEAKALWQAQGFPPVPGETEFIPLPET